VRRAARVGPSLVVALLMFAAAACAAAERGGTSQTEEGKDKVAFVTAATVIAPKEEVATYAVAKALGFYEDENLEVEITQADGSTAAIQAVASGSADVTAADGGSTLAAVAKGVPIVAYAGLVQNWPWQVASLADGGISSVDELKGGRLGIISLSSGSAPYARGFLSASGLNPDSDTELVPVGVGPPAATALDKGEVDALALYTQAYADIENTGIKLKYLENPDLFEDLFSLTWQTTQSTLENDSDVIARFTRASFKALLFSATNPEAAMSIGYEEFPELAEGGTSGEAFQADVDSLRAWIATATPTEGEPESWGDWGEISQDSWDALQEFTLEYAGTIDEEQNIDELWDDSLLGDINDFDAQEVIDQANNYEG